MTTIQHEIEILKSKVDVENLSKKKEEKIRVLEEERNYFLAEALRMDKIFKTQSKSIESLSNEIAIFDEEKKFFEGFVLETNKENTKLKKKLLALGKALDGKDLDNGFPFTESARQTLLDKVDKGISFVSIEVFCL